MRHATTSGRVVGGLPVAVFLSLWLATGAAEPVAAEPLDAEPAAAAPAVAEPVAAEPAAAEPAAAEPAAALPAAVGAAIAVPTLALAVSAADEKIAAELKSFCVKWMGFLETRERDNRKAVKWQAGPERVAGQFVGYSKEYDCIMKERSSNGTPVAVIVYREFVYEQTGPSQGEAAQSEPAAVDATEVTEIFRYSKGQWVY